MARVVLVEAFPWDPATGAPKAVRLAGGGRWHYTHKGYVDWLAGVVATPKVTTEIGFAQGGFTGGAIPQAAAIGFSPSRRGTRAALARLMWSGAPVVVSVGDDQLAEPIWIIALAGTVAGYSIANGSFTFTMSDMAGKLARPFVAASFAGTGGIEGPVEATGRVKRRSLGQVFNVELRIVDAANGIYEASDPAFPLREFVAVKDRGRAGPMIVVGWAGSTAATFDALKAATAPEGGAAVAPSIACVKWWTIQPAPSPLTADIRGEIGTGYVETVPAIAARIIEAVAGPAVADLAWLVALRPDAAGIHIDSASETAAEILDRLLLGASLTWNVDPAGFTRLTPIAFANPVARLRVHAVEREAAFAPVTRVEVGYRRNHRQHGDAEISAAVRSDTIVMPDGATVDAAIVGAGKTAVWQQVSGFGRPTDYADVTALNIASGFAGQGPFSTITSAAYGSPLLTGFNALAALAKISLGGGYIFRADGSTALTDALAVTALGTAAAFAGQGPFSTIASVGYGSSLLTGFGALAPLGSLAFGSTYLRTGSGATATDALYQTGLGIASGFMGQGLLATLNQVANAQIAIGAISPSKLNIGDTSNMVPNPQVDELASWRVYSGPGAMFFGTSINDSNGNPIITQSLRTIRTPVGAIGGTGPVPVEQNVSYAFGVTSWASSTAGSQAIVARWFSDVQATELISTDVLRPAFTSKSQSIGTWQRTAPAGAVACALCMDATNSSAAPYITAPIMRRATDGALLTPTAVRLGTNIVRADGSTVLTEALVVTAVGTAAGFVGQGPFSTVTSVGYGSALLTGFGALAPLGSVAFGSSYLKTSAGAAATEALYQTGLGTAAGIAGQGALALKNTVNLATDEVQGRFAANLFWGNTGPAGGSVESLKPGEAGSNKTETRTAAAVVNQGPFTTAGQLGRAQTQGATSFFALNSFSLGYSITRQDGASIVTESLAITQLGIAAGIQGQGALALQNTVSGDQIVNGVVKNTDASVTFDLSNAKGIISRTQGSVRMMQGNGFGGASDLLEWFGPASVPVGSETVANSYNAKATDGRYVINSAPTGAGASGGASLKTSGRFTIFSQSGQQVNTQITSVAGKARLTLGGSGGGADTAASGRMFITVALGAVTLFSETLEVFADGSTNFGVLSQAAASLIDVPAGTANLTIRAQRVGGTGVSNTNFLLSYTLEIL